MHVSHFLLQTDAHFGLGLSAFFSRLLYSGHFGKWQ